MKKVFLLIAAMALTLASCHKEQLKGYYVTSIKVNTFPSTNMALQPWDGVDPYPDIYFTITSFDYPAPIYQSSIYLNCNWLTDYTWAVNSGQFLAINDFLSVELNDDDTGSNEYIASVNVGFLNPDTNQTEYVFTNDGATITITVQWVIE